MAGRKSAASLATVAVLSDDRIDAPRHLTPEQATEWRAIVDSLPADYFRPGDVPLLTAFCAASALHKQAMLDISTRGMMYENERGNLCQNPATNILATQAASMAQMAIKLRLCPSARYSEKDKSLDVSVKTARPWVA